MQNEKLFFVTCIDDQSHNWKIYQPFCTKCCSSQKNVIGSLNFIRMISRGHWNLEGRGHNYSYCQVCYRPRSIWQKFGCAKICTLRFLICCLIRKKNIQTLDRLNNFLKFWLYTLKRELEMMWVKIFFQSDFALVLKDRY